MKISRLGLVRNHIDTPVVDTRIVKIRKISDHDTHQFYDFTIDGKSMFKSIAHGAPGAPALSTMLRSGFAKKEQQKYIDMLLGQKPGDCAQGRDIAEILP